MNVATCIAYKKNINMNAKTDFTEVIEFDSSHGFLLLMALLSYRLLFHTDRHLNFFSLVLCVACAYSGTQIGAVLLGIAPQPIHLLDAKHNGSLFAHLHYVSSAAAVSIKGVSVSVLEQVCMSGMLDFLDSSVRERCSNGVDWLRGGVV